jgi:hypothetical protein
MKEGVVMILNLRRVFWWTVIGLAAVVLIGPVMTVVGTVLPFTLIGGLVWLTARGVRRVAARFRGVSPPLKPALQAVPDVIGGAKQAVQDGIRKCKDLAPVVRKQVEDVGRGAKEALGQGVHHCREAMPAVCKGARRLGEGVASRARAAARVLTEVVCGGLAGALIGWYAVGGEEAIAVGSLAGVALGVVTSIVSRQPAREVAAQ